MIHSRRAVLVAITLLLMVVLAPVTFAKGGALSKAMQSFLDENFPGQAFLPCAGADSRFGPPTNWLYVKNAAGKSWSTGKTSAWLAYSDGRNVYDEETVRLHTEPVTLANLRMDSKQKWGLAFALTGSTGDIDLDATIDIAISKGLEAQISAGEVEIVYGYYGDFLQAQEENSRQLQSLITALKNRFGKMPDRRVVTAALRARGTTISVNRASEFSVNANLELIAALNELGFTWDNTQNRFLDLSTGDQWRYLAFQALLADKNTGKISTGAVSTDVRPTDFAVDQIYPWMLPDDAVPAY